MTIGLAEEIDGVLAAAWPQLRTAAPPVPLTGGFWARMWRVRVTGQPDPMPGEVVVRYAPHRMMGAKEAPPISDAVRRAAPEVAWTVPELTAQLRLGAEAIGRADVADALDRLAARAPVPDHPVPCHGDLHPFNVLADADGLTLLDWTGAALADPCFDVAFTELLLANPPLPLPAPLALALRAAGRLLARRFVAAYQRANPRASLGELGWFRALHSARILIEDTLLRAERGPDAGGHPLRLVVPAVAHHLAAATGVEVRR